MKLLKQSADGWQYELRLEEAMCLRALVREFPFTPPDVAIITKTDTGHQAAGRGRLLNESLAEHRADLKQQSRKFLAAGKLEVGNGGCRLNVSPEDREMLLQLLNDIRIGCWRALGEPENVELPPALTAEPEMRHYQFMQLAGFFEFHLLNLETTEGLTHDT